MTKPSIKMGFQDWSPDTAAIYNEGMTEIQNCMPYLQLPNYGPSPSVSLSAIGNINGSNTVVNAVDNNNTAYLSRASALSGVSNSKSGSASFWIRVDGSTPSGSFVFDIVDGSTRFNIGWSTVGPISVIGVNSSGTTIMNFVGSTTLAVGSVWHNILITWDLAAGTRQMYIDNVAETLVVNTFTNDTIEYNGPNCSIFANPSGGLIGNCALSEIWINFGSTLDFTKDRKSVV